MPNGEGCFAPDKWQNAHFEFFFYFFFFNNYFFVLHQIWQTFKIFHQEHFKIWSHPKFTPGGRHIGFQNSGLKKLEIF